MNDHIEERYIQQRAWEDYILIRDRILFLVGYNDDGAVKEWGQLNKALLEFHSRYDEDSLDLRYQESLERMGEDWPGFAYTLMDRTFIYE